MAFECGRADAWSTVSVSFQVIVEQGSPWLWAATCPWRGTRLFRAVEQGQQAVVALCLSTSGGSTEHGGGGNAQGEKLLAELQRRFPSAVPSCSMDIEHRQ
ncbi:hypothetical protein [Streptomyces sp. NPDC055134]